MTLLREDTNLAEVLDENSYVIRRVDDLWTFSNVQTQVLDSGHEMVVWEDIIQAVNWSGLMCAIEEDFLEPDVPGDRFKNYTVKQLAGVSVFEDITARMVQLMKNTVGDMNILLDMMRKAGLETEVEVHTQGNGPTDVTCKIRKVL